MAQNEVNNQTNEPMVQETYVKIHWTLFKTLIVCLLFTAGAICIYFGISPLIDMEFEIKSFANLVFVIFNIYYMVSFFGVVKTSQFIFWCGSYTLLIFSSFMFFFYDDIFV